MKKISLVALSLFLAASAFAATQKTPDWIAGVSKKYSSERYIIGVGLGDSLDSARSNARAEIAKVFKAKVSQSAIDTASESNTGKSGKATSSYSSETRTNVSTEKVLEGVEIADTYIDVKKKTTYALAVLDKLKLSNSLSQKILDQEETIKSQLDAFDKALNPVEVVRLTSSALRALKQIDIIMEEKKIIDPVSIPSVYGAQKNDIEKNMNDNIRKIVFVVDSENNTSLSELVASKISKFGFKVINTLPKEMEPAVTYMTMRCKITLSPIERNNPQWKFYDWRSSVELFDNSNANTVISSASKDGRVSQLSIEAAKNSASIAAVASAGYSAEEKIKSYFFGE